MKKLIIILFSLSLVACNNAVSKINEKTQNVEKNDQNYQSPPNIILVESNNDNEHKAHLGTYSWNNIETDTKNPVNLTKNDQELIVSPGSKIKLKFIPYLKPVKIETFLWENQRRGKKLEVTNNSIVVPDKTGEYILEIIIEWPQGIVHYGSKIEVQ